MTPGCGRRSAPVDSRRQGEVARRSWWNQVEAWFFRAKRLGLSGAAELKPLGRF